jgi:transcriptional regulator with XRE-family HTH domain
LHLFTFPWHTYDMAKSHHRIKELRQRKKLSQVTAAKACGVTQGAWCQWEKGRWPDAGKLERIAEVLGVRIQELFA